MPATHFIEVYEQALDANTRTAPIRRFDASSGGGGDKYIATWWVLFRRAEQFNATG